ALAGLDALWGTIALLADLGLLGLLVLDARLSAGLGAVRIRRVVPPRIGRRKQFRSRIELDNPTPRRLEVEILDRLPPEFTPREGRHRLTLAPHARSSADLATRALVRGKYELGAVVAQSKSPLGLLRIGWTAADTGGPLAVLPDTSALGQFD